MTPDSFSDHQRYSGRPPVAVQILVILGYTGFAIPVSIVAMLEFGVLGLALAAFLGWLWIRVAGMGTGPDVSELVERLRPQLTDAPKTSGNASFDAYRAELIARLETEQNDFEDFLTRLRAAKDKVEFEGFMTDRERLQRAQTDGLPA